jgi:hypothetical protein
MDIRQSRVSFSEMLLGNLELVSSKNKKKGLWGLQASFDKREGDPDLVTTFVADLPFTILVVSEVFFGVCFPPLR